MESEHYFGEWVYYDDEEERSKALQYLDLWKFFIVKKLFPLEYVSDQLIDKPPLLTIGKSTIGLKIQMKGNKPDDVLDLSQIHPVVSNGKRI